MTYSQPPHSSASGQLLSVADLAGRSGLRADLVAQFIPPATTSAAGPLYDVSQVALAQFVKGLTDAGTPPAQVQRAVQESSGPAAPHKGAADKSRQRIVLAAVIAVTLVVGGAVGAVIDAAARQSAAAPPPAPVTVTEKLQGNLPTTPDPVCAMWGPINDRYKAKRVAWVAIDPSLAADQWTPEQRALSLAVIPNLKAEASDLQGLAQKAQDPILRVLLQLTAEYQSVYADRLPNYSPADDGKLWDAATSNATAGLARCWAMAPK